MTKKEFVSMSLPYGLKVLIPESDKKGCRKTVIGTVGAVYDDGSIACHDTINTFPKWYKPILHKLTDITKFDSYVAECFLSKDVMKLMKLDMIADTKISYFEFIFLVKNHFDVAELISQGQAIDVNTLEVNPYKNTKFL